MNFIKIAKYKEKEIVHIDLSKCPTAQIPSVLQEAHQVIKKYPAKSALVFTDVTGAIYNKEIASAMKDFTRDNTPYIKASAVKGAEGVRMVLLQTVALMTRREIKTFDSETAAMDWLVSV